MSIQYEFNQQTGHLTLTLRSTLNFSIMHEFRNIYHQIETANQITIDFTYTDFVDSSGLSMLLYLQKHYQCPKHAIHLINCNNIIIKTLDMAHFNKLFTY